MNAKFITYADHTSCVFNLPSATTYCSELHKTLLSTQFHKSSQKCANQITELYHQYLHENVFESYIVFTGLI